MNSAKTMKPRATVRVRRRRPPVISENQSRHASRASCRANQPIVPARLMPRAASLRDQSEEGVLQADVAGAGLAAQLIQRARRRSALPLAMTPMRSAMRSATSRMCVVMMTEHPAWTRSRSTSLTTRDEPASRPVNGSSRMMSLGSCTSAPASATFWRMPLDSRSQRSSACGARPSQREQVARPRLGEIAVDRPQVRRRSRDIPSASVCRRSSARPIPRP